MANDYYDTLEEAAAAAMHRIERQDKARTQEYMGLLFQNDDGKYIVSDIQTNGRNQTVSWRGKPLGKVVGIVHNHPEPNRKRPDPPGFSSDDIDMAKQLGVPSYVVEMRDGSPIVYSPGETSHRTERGTRGAAARSHAAGDPFLGPIPTREILNQIAMRVQGSGMPDDMKRRLLATLVGAPTS